MSAGEREVRNKARTRPNKATEVPAAPTSSQKLISATTQNQNLNLPQKQTDSVTKNINVLNTFSNPYNLVSTNPTSSLPLNTPFKNATITINHSTSGNGSYSSTVTPWPKSFSLIKTNTNVDVCQYVISDYPIFSYTNLNTNPINDVKKIVHQEINRLELEHTIFKGNGSIRLADLNASLKKVATT